jgi:hypothetical protein
MRFSERKGLKPLSKVIQIDNMAEELRNSIWNVLDLFVWKRKYFMSAPSHMEPDIKKFSTYIWFTYFKKPLDQRPEHATQVLAEIRKYFFQCKWYEVYDFLEHVLNYFKDAELNSIVNIALEKELAGYHFLSNCITDISNHQEIEMLEEALADEDFPAVRAHLKRALELLSDRKSPDYRNSIKESISAVESIAQLITNLPKATLGDALKVLERKSKIHPALKEGFANLYGYTCDEGGIRHAMLEEPNLSASDAKFFLLSCTSFVNYLKSKT